MYNQWIGLNILNPFPHKHSSLQKIFNNSLKSYGFLTRAFWSYKTLALIQWGNFHFPVNYCFQFTDISLILFLSTWLTHHVNLSRLFSFGTRWDSAYILKWLLMTIDWNTYLTANAMHTRWFLNLVKQSFKNTWFFQHFKSFKATICKFGPLDG